VSDADDSFLSRWSRRKARVRDGQVGPAVPEPASKPVVPASDTPATHGTTSSTTAAAPIPNELPAHAEPLAQEAAPLPTMDDVARLTRESDFSPFVRPGVDAGVKNAALKKLFSDPHFNVMDGLDTYIDDYGKPDPIPPAMLRRMTQSAMLGLFDDEPDPDAREARGNETAPGPVNPDGSAAVAVAQSSDPREPAITPPPAETRPDDDPDLRLQQDHAAERSGAAPGPRS